jgi:hypothetical protein
VIRTSRTSKNIFARSEWRSERFVYNPISRVGFAEVFDQGKRWGLDQHIKERNFENLAAPTGS